MRKRNIITIIISVAFFIIAVALLYRYLAPPSPGSGVKVSVPAPVDPTFNQEQLNVLQNDVIDYNVDVDPVENKTQSNSSNTGTNQQTGGN